MDLTARWFGDRAVLVDVQEPAQREQVAALLAGEFPDLQVRRGMVSVLVEVDSPEAHLLDRVNSALSEVAVSSVLRPGSATAHLVRATYDGEDLEEVSQLLEATTSAVVQAHLAQTWRVAMIGFAPGFAYLEPVGPVTMDWARVPRRDTPRSRVPAGSLALAAGMSAVYPASMPGGWHLVGTTREVMFDPARGDRPALLAPGDDVRFEVGDE